MAARPDPADPIWIDLFFVSRDLKKTSRIRYDSRIVSRSRGRSKRSSKEGKEIGSGQRGSFVASTIMIIALFLLLLLYFLSLFFFLSLSRKEKAEEGRTSGRDDHADVRCVVRAAASSRPSPPSPHDLPSMAEDGRWSVAAEATDVLRLQASVATTSLLSPASRRPPLAIDSFFLVYVPPLPLSSPPLCFVFRLWNFSRFFRYRLNKFFLCFVFSFRENYPCVIF